MSPRPTAFASIRRRLDALFAASPIEGRLHAGHAASLISFKGQRAENQDRAFVAFLSPSPGQALFVAGVLDGMGAMEEGGKAASVAASSFIQSLTTSFEFDLTTALTMAIWEANAAVWATLRGRGGTTLTAVAITPRAQCIAIHVGDSRLYRTSPGFNQVTTDDTLSGLLGDDFAGADDGLLQFVGIGDQMSRQTFDLSEDQGDLLLLATDGFDVGRDGAFLTVMADGADVAREALMREPERLSFRDNATAVTIHRQQALSELAMPRKSALLVNSTTGYCAI